MLFKIRHIFKPPHTAPPVTNIIIAVSIQEFMGLLTQQFFLFLETPENRDFPDDHSLAMPRSLCVNKYPYFTADSGSHCRTICLIEGLGPTYSRNPLKTQLYRHTQGSSAQTDPPSPPLTKLAGHLLHYPMSGTGGGNHNRRIRSRIALNS